MLQVRPSWEYNQTCRCMGSARLLERHHPCQIFCRQTLPVPYSLLKLPLVSRTQAGCLKPAVSLPPPPAPPPLCTGGLQSTLRSLSETSSVTATVRELQQLDARLGQINTLPKPSYGSAASASTSASLSSTAASTAAFGTLNLTATTATTSATTTTGRRSSAAATAPLEDFGAAPLSDTMKRLARVPKDKPHVARRLKLRPMAVSEAQRTVMSTEGGAAPRDELAVLAVMADWSPVCVKLDPRLQVGVVERNAWAG